MTSAKDDARRSRAFVGAFPPRPRSHGLMGRGLTATLLVVGLLVSPSALDLIPGSPLVQLVLAALLGLGVLVAAAAFGALGLAALMPRRSPRLWAIGPAARAASPPRETALGARAPADTTAGLQVVSGSDPRRVAAALLALAGAFRTAGRRVVMVDASRVLALHETLGRDAHWGLGECLREAMPALGVLQETGYAGIRMLGRGSIASAERWSHLGRVLDELAPHFDRVILALDPTAPRAAGEVLRGRSMEGWWAAASRSSRAARVFRERIGIPLRSLELQSSPQALLEALRGQWSRVAPEPEKTAVEPRATVPETVPAAPRVVDCDPRVRERLRFLLWARRLRRGGAGAPPSIARLDRSSRVRAPAACRPEPEPAHTV